MKKMTLIMTAQEIDFLKSLLKDEVFQLSGVKRISKIDALSRELQVAESLERKIEEAKLIAA